MCALFTEESENNAKVSNMFSYFMQNSVPRCVVLTFGIWFAPWRQKRQNIELAAIINKVGSENELTCLAWSYAWDLVFSDLVSLVRWSVETKEKNLWCEQNELKYQKRPQILHNFAFI